MPQVPHRRPPRPDPQPPSLTRLGRAPQRAIEGKGEGPRAAINLAERVIGIGVAKDRGDRPQRLAIKPLAVPPGHLMKGVAHIKQSRVCRVDLSVRPVREPRGGERTEHDHVAQPAAGFLEVGREQVGGNPKAGMPCRHRLSDLSEAAAGCFAPVLRNGRACGCHDVFVPGHEAQIQQTHRSAEIGRGD